jgi:hypothetical protein
MNATAHERKTLWTVREAVDAYIFECQQGREADKESDK